MIFYEKFRGVKTTIKKELAERFLCERELSKKIKHLSQGTLQKLGIIQAFSHRPELVILDEPTLGLDPLIKEEFYHFIRQYQQQGNTIFLSSHNLAEVEKICDRIAIIRNGTLVALESLDNLRKNRIRRLILKLKQPVALLNIPHTKILKQKGLQYELLVQGNIQAIVQELAKLPLDDFSFPEASLEEVFLYYYRDEKNG